MAFPILREFFVKALRLGSETGPRVLSGTGSPEGAITAPVGSLYAREDGGTNTTIYRKESGAGNTGWVAASNAGGAWTAYQAVLPNGIGVSDFEATVSDAAVSAASVIEIRLTATPDSAENEPEFTNLWAMTAHPATGSFLLTLSFAEHHSGPLNLQYRVN